MDRDRLHLVTPEGLTLDLDLAGPGSRGVAALIDLAIQLAAIILVSLALDGATNPSVIASILITVVITLGYYIFFEARASGQTPGKMTMRLRVVRMDGGPVRLAGVLLRTFLRIIDFLPLGYAVGMISVMSTSRNQRLGDLAAGTVVIQEGPRQKKREAAAVFATTTTPSVEESANSGWDVSRVTVEELALIRGYLDRRAGLERGPRWRLATNLADRVRPRVAAPPGVMSPEQFLEGVVRAKGHDVPGLGETSKGR